MSNKSQVKAIFLLTLLVATIVTLLMSVSPSIPLSSASPAIEYFASANPSRIQEGLDTNITVGLRGATTNTSYTFRINVTAPTGASFLANVTVPTNGTGYGIHTMKFLSSFTPAANTNYVGVYKIAVNQTLATSNFTVGLTDKSKYVRFDTVNIRAAGYSINETVGVDIKFGGSFATGFPRNVTASQDGVVTGSWVVLANASAGIYTLTIINATTGGTVKSPPDVQTFIIQGVCEIQTRNLANQTLSDVDVEVYNATSGAFLSLSQNTNTTGWARFILDAGNYTFKAFWKNVQVGTVNQTVSENVLLSMTVWLSNIKLTVTDESANLLPWIALNIKYNYTARNGQTFPGNDTFTTNLTGLVQTTNMFANTSYVIEAKRYGFLFNTTSLKSLPKGWNNITIIAPTYTLLVQVRDSKNASAMGVTVLAYEWSSGIGMPPQASKLTDANGNVTFSLTFGKYRLRLYKDTTFLEEATVDLIQNQSSLVIRSNVFNVDLSVLVLDYFGQPILNASVELQRKNNSDFETVQTKTTESDGIALFSGIIGGDSRVSVSVTGSADETQYLSLVDSQQMVFRFDGYVAIVGQTLETSQFVTLVILIIVIIAFIIASTYKKLPHLFHRQKK